LKITLSCPQVNLAQCSDVVFLEVRFYGETELVNENLFEGRDVVLFVE